MLTYGQQSSIIVFGDVGSPVNLSTSYADNVKVFTVENMAQVYFEFEYTTGAAGDGNTVEFKIESSIDAAGGGASMGTPTPRFSQDLTNSVSSGVVTLSDEEFHYTATTGGTLYARGFYFPVAVKQLRISAKEVINAGASGTLFMRALLSGL